MKGEVAIEAPDGRVWLPIGGDPRDMEQAHEMAQHRNMLAFALFVAPDFEFHIACPKHGEDIVTWVEPLPWVHAVASNRLWTNPN